MSKIVNFSKEIFSEKELKDFRRRAKVAQLLRGGETWEKIKGKTGAHLQTIALVSKRLKLSKRKTPQRLVTPPIFTFGQLSEVVEP